MSRTITDPDIIEALHELGYRSSTLPGVNGAMDILNNKDHCIQFLDRLGKGGGVATTERVLREALNWPTEKETPTMSDTPAKNPGVVEHLKKICKKGKTLDQIMEAMTAKFPERDADKMKATVRTQLGGRLKSSGTEVTKEKNNAGAMVYTIAT